MTTASSVDNTLLWKNHIECIHKKLLRFVGILYKLRYKLDSKVLKTLYFSFIYPQLLYGVEIYATTNKSSLQSLIKNQIKKHLLCQVQ